jgi:aryl-alcohol dehydrogenase (NADP+)
VYTHRRVDDAGGALPARGGVPRAQGAVAGGLPPLGFSAPMAAATKPGHIADAIAALELTLSDDEVEALEAPYLPHATVGFE